jgi:hypothetical protein
MSTILFVIISLAVIAFAILTQRGLLICEKGVFNTKVEHIQRASRYPSEFDFSQLDDDHKLKKSIHKHYSELRKLVDIDEENPATLAKYLGMGKKQPYAEWIEEYVKG